MARLSDEEIDERLSALPAWEAEEMNHHPDLEISWNTVTVSVTTHSEGGLTENDFQLARRIERLA